MWIYKLIRKIKSVINRVVLIFGYKFISVEKKQHKQTDDWVYDLAIVCKQNNASIKTIVDVGANRGYIANHLSGAFPGAHVYCFEPAIDNYKILCEEVSPNPIIKCFHMALGDEKKEGHLLISENHATNSLLGCENNNFGQAVGKIVGTEDITISTLDIIMDKLKIDQIDILKIDTQGYDLKVLKGGSKILSGHRVKWVLVECIFVPQYKGQCYADDIIKYMRIHGYIPMAIYSEKNIDFSNGLRTIDVLFSYINTNIEI